MIRAEKILNDNLEELHKLSKELLEREILDSDEIKKIMKGEELPPPRRNGGDQNETEKKDEIPNHVKELLKNREENSTDQKEEKSDVDNS